MSGQPLQSGQNLSECNISLQFETQIQDRYTWYLFEKRVCFRLKYLTHVFKSTDLLLSWGFRSTHRHSVNSSSWRVLVGNSNFRMETSSPTKMEIIFSILWADLLHIYITPDTTTHSKHFQHHISNYVKWAVSEESTFCTGYNIWFSVVLKLMGHVIWRSLQDLFCDNKCSMSSYLAVSLWLYKVVYVDRWWIVWATVNHMYSMVVRVGTLDCSW